MSVLILCSNLMFASRVSGAAKALGIDLQIIPSAADLAAQASDKTRLVIVDLSQSSLDLPALVADVRSRAPLAKVVAFGSHVNEAALNSARAAGCDEVMPNSQFDRSYVELLKVWGVAPQQPRS